MSEVPQVSEALEGYAVLAQQLVADWTPYLTEVSAKLGSGTYGPDDAGDDFSALAKLIADSLFAIGSEAMDALAILTSDFSEESTIGGFGTDPSKAGTVRTLTVKGDLVSVSGQVLPKGRVTPVPNSLVPPATQFVLDVNGDGMKARTYDGVVLSTDAAGAVQEIPVSVMVG